MDNTDILNEILCGNKAAPIDPTDLDDILYNDTAESMDDQAKKQTIKSEEAYRKIAQDIVGVSKTQLTKQNKSKTFLKTIFTLFFIAFIIVQYIAMIMMLRGELFGSNVVLSDTVIVTYISSVFVETLGAIIFMIKYAFDSSQEVNILQILNGIIEHYQKFKD